MVSFIAFLIATHPEHLKWFVPFGMTPILYIIIYLAHSVSTGRKEMIKAVNSLSVLLALMGAYSVLMFLFAFSVRNYEKPLEYEIAYYGGIGYTITTIIAVIISSREILFLIRHRKRNSLDK